MRKTALSSAIAALLVCACSLAPKAIAADATASTQAIQPAKLPYGVEDVLKLARANVPEATIVSFIQNSGMVYDLGAQDIVYLRNEGVPDRVINAMLEEKRKLIERTGQAASQTATSTAAPTPAAQVAEPTGSSQPAPVYVQPTAQPGPSSVYVIPYPAVPSAYYGYYRPYPYYYGGYWGPSISLGFRFGGGPYWHGHPRHWRRCW